MIKNKRETNIGNLKEKYLEIIIHYTLYEDKKRLLVYIITK